MSQDERFRQPHKKTHSTAGLPPQDPPTIPEVIPDAHIAPEFPDGMPIPSELNTPPTIALEAPTISPPPQPMTVTSKTSKATGSKSLSPTAKSMSAPVPRSEKVASTPVVSTPRKKSSAPAKRRTHYNLLTFASALRSVSITLAAAVISATIFMWWTSPDFLPAQTRIELAAVQVTAQSVIATRTPVPTPVWSNRVGIIAGHSGIAQRGRSKGNPDPGAICPDGFFERQVTEGVAQRAAALLRGRGFTVDILEEYDMRLFDYQAAAVIALHADSCVDEGYGGFKSAPPALRNTVRIQDDQLNICIQRNYAAITNLDFLPNNITRDMTEYHAWEEIAKTTPAVILEVGYLSVNRNLLEHEQDRIAVGVVNGLLCYLAPEGIGPTPQPLASTTAQDPNSPAIVTPVLATPTLAIIEPTIEVTAAAQ